MITIGNIKYGKADGSLTLNLQELTEEEKKRVVPYARVQPSLSFKTDAETTASIYLPFITIASTFAPISRIRASFNPRKGAFCFLTTSAK